MQCHTASPGCDPFENVVWKIAATLSRLQCFNSYYTGTGFPQLQTISNHYKRALKHALHAWFLACDLPKPLSNSFFKWEKMFCDAWCSVSVCTLLCVVSLSQTRINLCMHPANERQLYTVTLSLIGWAHTQNDPWSNNQINLLQDLHYGNNWFMNLWLRPQEKEKVYFLFILVTQQSISIGSAIRCISALVNAYLVSGWYHVTQWASLLMTAVTMALCQDGIVLYVLAISQHWFR